MILIVNFKQVWEKIYPRYKTEMIYLGVVISVILFLQFVCVPFYNGLVYEKNTRVIESNTKEYETKAVEAAANSARLEANANRISGQAEDKFNSSEQISEKRKKLNEKIADLSNRRVNSNRGGAGITSTELERLLDEADPPGSNSPER